MDERPRWGSWALSHQHLLPPENIALCGRSCDGSRSCQPVTCSPHGLLMAVQGWPGGRACSVLLQPSLGLNSRCHLAKWAVSSKCFLLLINHSYHVIPRALFMSSLWLGPLRKELNIIVFFPPGEEKRNIFNMVMQKKKKKKPILLNIFVLDEINFSK